MRLKIVKNGEKGWRGWYSSTSGIKKLKFEWD